MVVVKYSTIINGYTSLNLTKLDVLDDLDEIKIGVTYIIGDKKLETFPANLSLLENANVEYISFPGWKQDISKIRTFDNLPVEAQNYISFIEKFVGVPIKWIGVGPGREDTIEK